MDKRSETLFVSDLHLDDSRPAITSLFLDFLQKSATQADALYILGDLFEVWIGDDDTSELSRQIATGLNQLKQTGTPVYLMHGNRDFLIGNEFEDTSSCTIISDPTVINLYGTDTVLLHGDTLCTDDTEYMDFRTMVRSPDWQKEFLGKPLPERKNIASDLREQSKEKTRAKPMDIMDVNQQTVEKVLKKHNTLHMIHGHTHRPDIHKFSLNSGSAQRIVLGDWYQNGSVLRCSPENCKLETLKP